MVQATKKRGMSVVDEVHDWTDPHGEESPVAKASPRSARPGAGVRALLRWIIANPGLTLAIVVLAVAVLWAVAPSLFTSEGPDTLNLTQIFKAPSSAHWFGTDQLGRDQFSRVVYGARESLTGSVIAVGVGFALGSTVGAIAGWFGGIVETLVMRFIDVLLAIPFFLLVVTIVVLLGFGAVHAALAVGLSTSAVFARLTRGEVLRVRSSQYVEAAVAGGVGPWAILRRHVLPNSIAPALALVTLQLGVAIIVLASLSFLGFGAQPPTPEWGLMVSQGRDYIAANYWWLIAFPGLTIVAVVLACNRVGHHLAGRG
jgi:peptide/nickel transport system permease protein